MVRNRSAEVVALTKVAADLVRASLRGDKLAAKLAFGSGEGQAHSDGTPGMADVWLSSRLVARIEREESRKIGEKIGTRSRRASTTTTSS